MSEYQQCTRCIMDTTTTLISFDENGVCNFCHDYDSYVKEYIGSEEECKAELQKSVTRIKEEGKNDEYDCIVGLSGGVDSSYVALLCKDLGLRPLIFHFDNGWNSELAVRNINNICKKLNFDLHTYVVDWPKFKDLQLAYIKSGVIDWEVPTDHFIFSSMIEVVREFGIKNIISGSNIKTEFTLPLDWICGGKLDYVNLKNIHNKFATTSIDSLPKISEKDKDYFYGKHKKKPFQILSYVNFDKDKALQRLVEEVDYKPYSSKHYESVYTRFYQGYVLPNRLNIDKRKAHLSSLIQGGMLSKEAALKEISTSPYDDDMLKKDFDFILNKLELTEQEFRKYMDQPVVSHKEFGTHWDEKYKRFDVKLKLFWEYKIKQKLFGKKAN